MWASAIAIVDGVMRPVENNRCMAEAQYYTDVPELSHRGGSFCAASGGSAGLSRPLENAQKTVALSVSALWSSKEPGLDRTRMDYICVACTF